MATLMLDCDTEGEMGVRQALVEIAQRCTVRVARSSSMHGGAFKGRLPKSLSREVWEGIRSVLVRPHGQEL